MKTELSTHRLLQIHILMDECQSRVRMDRGNAPKLARIGNHKGAAYLLARAARFESITARCERRLQPQTFGDFARNCKSRVSPAAERRPGNALNIEIGAPMDRCMMQSPDGRGSLWLRSGGELLAYGICRCGTCPLLRDRETIDAFRKLTFAARTSGGVAGRDEGLVAACDAAERLLARAPA